MINKITNWLRSIFSSSDQLTISKIDEVDYSNETLPPTASVPPGELWEQPTQPIVEAIEETMEEAVAPVVEEVKQAPKPRRRNNRRKKKPTQSTFTQPHKESQPQESVAVVPQKEKGRGRPKKSN